ncbi:ABC transporter substrate-binding protein [Methanococcus voltae]|uniref:Iron complex transport system substrate-binding protein n=2 Tax=Methanococcus voltae TaxID=2188 RepID=A0A8J7RF41_METVO|nr:ABC transporter substrate-binding protein [Methanococcus voltae]MBP2171971.1 iron complex transport system substrate-binding protein [Methanococcus voltae]MBP2201074.1 iron complex transport system substrate-binding protein [Methanococcus voltae]MCS3921797.1 iron complex transport system substrate-binding protein [Methanococcus voltae PS]
MSSFKTKMGFLILLTIFLIPSSFASGNYDYRLGDVNCDGKISVSDVVYLFNIRNMDIEDGDVNADNKISVSDVVYLFNYYDKMSEPIAYAKSMDLVYYDADGLEVNPYNGESFEYKIFTDGAGVKYLLKNQSQNVPTWANVKYDTIITTPVDNVVSTSTVHVAYLVCNDENGDVMNTLKGVSTTTGVKPWHFDYINQHLTGIEGSDNKIVHLGHPDSLDYEKLTTLNPDFVMNSLDGNRGSTIDSNCRDKDITCIAFPSWTEQTFLGRCEWAKAMAAFYNKEKFVSSYFSKVEKKSLNAKRAASGTNAPTVSWGYITSKGYASIPAAQSYYARGITQNCKADYLFTQYTGTGFAKLTKEEFLETTKNADLWVVSSATKYLSKFKERHVGYEQLNPVINGRVFCYSSDFYQTGVVNTDEILMDMGTIMYPDDFKGRSTRYLLAYDPETNTGTPYTA